MEEIIRNGGKTSKEGRNKKIFLVAFKESRTGNKFRGRSGYEIRKDKNYRDKRIKE
jgi:hypothetical protein